MACSRGGGGGGGGNASSDSEPKPEPEPEPEPEQPVTGIDVLLWLLGNEDGDFGLTACQNALDSGTHDNGAGLSAHPAAVAVKANDFTKAYFYGSTKSYHYKDLRTTLNLSGDLTTLKVGAYNDASASFMGDPAWKADKILLTTTHILAQDQVSLFSHALDMPDGARFWTFTMQISLEYGVFGEGLSSTSSGSNCQDATSNIDPYDNGGTKRNAQGIIGLVNHGSNVLLSNGGTNCDVNRYIICISAK